MGVGYASEISEIRVSKAEVCAQQSEGFFIFKPFFFSFCVSCPQKKSSKGKEKKLKRKEVSSEIFLCKSNLIIRIHFKPSLTCDRETHQGHS